MPSRAPLLNIQNAAKELGIAVVTLRKYIRKGKIEPTRLGGLLRFRREEIDRVKKDGIVFRRQEAILDEQ